jgi:hypothetical protein
MKSRKTLRRFLKCFCWFIAAYILIYVVLSAFGSYQPFTVGTFGVKQYLWAPRGFYDADHPWPGSAVAELSKDKKTGGWSSFMCWTFFPLWTIDASCIHKNPPNPAN